MQDDDVSFLEVKKEDMVPMPPQEKVWAQISDDCQLEFIDWAMINALAAQFDELHKANEKKSDSHVICKLLTLVRDIVAAETEAKVMARHSANQAIRNAREESVLAGERPVE